MQKFALAAVLALVSAPSFAQSTGHASFYGRELAGRRTASGEKFNPGAMTAAHRSLPFGTKLKLTNLNNGRTVVVRINDRGPFVRGRVLDVSHGAAIALGFAGQGTARLHIENMLGGSRESAPSAPLAPSAPVVQPEPTEATPDWRTANAEQALQNR